MLSSLSPSARKKGGGGRAKPKKEMDVLPIPLSEKPKDKPSIARAEFAVARAKREATAKGEFYMSQLSKAIEKKDRETALMILAAARKQFKKGENAKMISHVNSLHVKIKGEFAIEQAMECRKERDYNKAVELVSESLFHFKVLSGVTEVYRDMPASEAARLENDRRLYLQIRNPGEYVRKLAIEDGDAARARSIAKLDERNFPEAKAELEDAKVCFEWAQLDADETGLDELSNNINLSESASFGDGLLEDIAAALKPVVHKDYKALLSSLNEAMRAYEGALDDAGVKVVARMKTCLASIRAGDVAWYNLSHALKRNDYSDALSHLIVARKCLYQSSRGLPNVNTEMDRILCVLLNEEMPSLTMIAELAVRDGQTFKSDSREALHKTILDEAASLANSASKCFDWVISRGKALDDQFQKEDLSSGGEHEVDDVDDTTKEIPDLELCETVMKRFLGTFPSIKEEPLRVDIGKALDAAASTKDIMQQVAKRNALIKAEGLMGSFYDKEAKNELTSAFKDLELAKSVYSEAGFEGYASNAGTIKVNTMADVAAEKIMPLLAEGKQVEAESNMREALYYYEQTGNKSKSDAMSATLLCSQGDQLLSSFDKALEVGDYDTALGHGLEAVEMYRKSGDKERLSLLGDPKVAVWRRAVADAESLKLESLSAVDDKDLSRARNLAMKAKNCLVWSGESVRVIDDIFSVIKMAEKKWKGVDLMEKALSNLGDSDREKTKQMLWLATAAYQEAQLAYQQLMARASEILSDPNVEPTFSLELQDNVTKIYNVCVDGTIIANLHNLEIALRADERLDQVGVLIKAELFAEAKGLIDEARKVYFDIGLGQENERIKKTDAMLDLVAYGMEYSISVGRKKFEESKEHIQKCKELLQVVSSSAPATIRAPDPLCFGDMNAADTVIVRAITSGEKDLRDAKDYLKQQNYEAALLECDKAMRSYDWVALYKDFSEIEKPVNELKLFIALVKREANFAKGEASLEKAHNAMSDEKQQFPLAILKFGEAVDYFTKAEAVDKVAEAVKLKAWANGCLCEKQARELWAKKDFRKALDKCVKGLEGFSEGNVPDRKQKLGHFSKRVEGDLIMLRYNAALEDSDWDRACKVMSDAHDCYNSSHDPKIMSLIEGVLPKNKVMQEAIKKGEALKLSASGCLHRGGGTVQAQEHLDKAKSCFLWSDVSLAKAGINMIQKDIDSAQFQEKGDRELVEAYSRWTAGDVRGAVESMMKGKEYFKKSGPGCFKIANDTSYVINVMESAKQNSLKCIEGMIVEENIIDALDKCSAVHASWTAVVRIQDPCQSLKSFVDFYVQKEHQLSIVMSLLAKKNQIVAEMAGNKWGPPPVALCEELSAIYESLRRLAGGWKLTFGFEFLEPLVVSAKLACGLIEEPEEKVLQKVLDDAADSDVKSQAKESDTIETGAEIGEEEEDEYTINTTQEGEEAGGSQEFEIEEEGTGDDDAAEVAEAAPQHIIGENVLAEEEGSQDSGEVAGEEVVEEEEESESIEESEEDGEEYEEYEEESSSCYEEGKAKKGDDETKSVNENEYASDEFESSLESSSKEKGSVN